MSSSLYWRAAPKALPPKHDLPSELKYAIARRFWGHDGSLYGDEIEMDKSSIGYLEGLVDGGVDGAQELIDAIRKETVVQLWIGA